MANQPCANRIICPGPTPGLDADDPIINFSSEAVDGINFTEMSWPLNDPYNPFVPTDPNNPPDTCDSPISQAEAELCAVRIPIVANPGVDPATGTSRQVFFSQAQSCAFNCPDGTAFLWKVPPGAFADISQSAANQKAAAYACKQVLLNAICIAIDTTSACLALPFLSTVSISGGQAPYTIGIITGALPPGVGFVQDTPSTAFFSGVPTTPGTYPIAIGARDSRGNTLSRTVVISVLGISNSTTIPLPAVGTFYNFQLQGIGGTGPYTFSGGSGLPGGLVLQSDGFIVGNPVAPIGTGFTATIRDSAGNACEFALTYQNACAFGSITWDAPPDVFNKPTLPNTFTFAVTFPTPHSIRAIGSATMVAIGQVLVWTNSNFNSVLTIPAGPARNCSIVATVRGSTGTNVYEGKVTDSTFAVVFGDTTQIISGPVGVVTTNFTIPAGVTQLGFSFSFQCGLPAPATSGSLDIQIDFGV